MKNLVFDIIEHLKPAFKEDPYMEAVYLFGSQARGDSTIFSDIDLAIISKSPELINRKALNYLAGNFDIECNFVYTTPELIQSSFRDLDINYSIKKEGILIWQR